MIRAEENHSRLTVVETHEQIPREYAPAERILLAVWYSLLLSRREMLSLQFDDIPNGLLSVSAVSVMRCHPSFRTKDPVTVPRDKWFAHVTWRERKTPFRPHSFIFPVTRTCSFSFSRFRGARAYLSLSQVSIVFADYGSRGLPSRKQKFVRHFVDFVTSRKKLSVNQRRLLTE